MIMESRVADRMPDVTPTP